MKSYDVIIVGTGIAGMYTAINIDKDLRVLLISKSSINDTNSDLAQGGIVSCINPQVHFQDTMRAGSFYNKEDTIRMVEEHSQENINSLIDYGVNFDRYEDGEFKFTREGGHSENTILYAKDSTGKEIMRALNKKIQGSKNIDLMENTSVIELIKIKGKISAIVVLNEREEIEVYESGNVVLATGGIGGIYKNTTNRFDMTGDGVSLAYEIGAKISDMEFIQFHPTAMYLRDNQRSFLISEAVRGEGAVLRNIKGQTFMHAYDERGDLAPRDIVSRSIVNEMKKTRSEYVYLDITNKDLDFIRDRFPAIYSHCLDKGIDISKEYIPVAPAEHYHMGGVSTDLEGNTNIEGLFACGECACTGFHGANRLASNSLLEAIVFGKKVAESINDRKGIGVVEVHELERLGNKYARYDKFDNTYQGKYSNIKEELRKTMTDFASVVKRREDLLQALKVIEELSKELGENPSIKKQYFELKSMIKVSKIIIESAIKREESLGTHFVVK